MRPDVGCVTTPRSRSSLPSVWTGSRNQPFRLLAWLCPPGTTDSFFPRVVGDDSHHFRWAGNGRLQRRSILLRYRPESPRLSLAVFNPYPARQESGVGGHRTHSFSEE